jgi:hypothetical protein
VLLRIKPDLGLIYGFSSRSLLAKIYDSIILLLMLAPVVSLHFVNLRDSTNCATLVLWQVYWMIAAYRIIIQTKNLYNASLLVRFDHVVEEAHKRIHTIKLDKR